MTNENKYVVVPRDLTDKMRWGMSCVMPLHGGALDDAWEAALAARPRDLTPADEAAQAASWASSCVTKPTDRHGVAGGDAGLREALAGILDRSASMHGDASYYGPEYDKSVYSARLRGALKTADMMIAGPIAAILAQRDTEIAKRKLFALQAFMEREQADETILALAALTPTAPPSPRVSGNREALISEKAKALCAEHCSSANPSPCDECTADKEHDWRNDADAALAASPPAEMAGVEESLHIVFDGPPGPEMPRFVEVENSEGRSIRASEWLSPARSGRRDGLWELRLAAIRTRQDTRAGGAVEGWQPIETAPKEMQPILLALYRGKHGDISRAPAIGYFRDRQGWTTWHDDQPLYATPTHWMPLPATPTGTDDGEGAHE